MKKWLEDASLTSGSCCHKISIVNSPIVELARLAMFGVYTSLIFSQSQISLRIAIVYLYKIQLLLKPKKIEHGFSNVKD